MDDICNRMAVQIDELRRRIQDLVRATGFRLRCVVCDIDIYAIRHRTTVGPVLYELDGRVHQCGGKDGR